LLTAAVLQALFIVCLVIPVMSRFDIMTPKATDSLKIAIQVLGVYGAVLALLYSCLEVGDSILVGRPVSLPEGYFICSLSVSPSVSLTA
jgi:hypothetical protein